MEDTAADQMGKWRVTRASGRGAGRDRPTESRIALPVFCELPSGTGPKSGKEDRDMGIRTVFNKLIATLLLLGLGSALAGCVLPPPPGPFGPPLRPPPGFRPGPYY